jgi:hypothetical protein
MIPGGSSACLQLFDNRTRRIDSWSFQTGWRIDLVDASIEYSSDLESDLVILHTAHVINGRPVAREYFAIGGDRLRLVRVEDEKGELFQNEYIYPNFEIGVVPDAKTVDQWVTLLASKDRADVLSALTFLGGRHIAEPDRNLLPEPQESKYAGLFRQLVGNPRIREIIAQLETSENEWVKHAAVLAARGPRDRLFN